MVSRPAPAAVVIQSLGGFRVLRRGVPVGPSQWPSRKARDLLKILVARRGRATPRDLLMEQLWPGDDRSKLGNRLSVALSTLRSVLDPERQFDSEHFIRADRDSAALDRDRVAVDVEVFLHEAEAGLAFRSAGRVDEAVERLEQAEAAYAGDFLDEDPYEEWAIPLREECRATYVEVAHALAADRPVDDDDASARYLLRILTRDAYDERAHLRLVAALERLGRRAEARRAYRRYVARMGEIGVAPTAFPTAGPPS
jgi:DNA-binding SARP family transcriptional activator